jgi:hypothetical protein
MKELMYNKMVQCKECDTYIHNYTELHSHASVCDLSLIFQCNGCDYSTKDSKEFVSHTDDCNNIDFPDRRSTLDRRDVNLEYASYQTVYFIYTLDSDGNYTNSCKIGYTAKTAESRLSSLQTGNDRQLKIYKSLCTGYACKWEKYLHNCLKNRHIRGEWYKISTKELDLILDIIIPMSLGDPTKLLS